MKRSVFFLVVGFGFGYVKAVSDHEDIRAAALTFQHFLLNLEEEQRKADEKQRARETAQEMQEEAPEPDEEIIEDAVPVPDGEDHDKGEIP